MGFINLIYTFIRCVASFVVPISIMWGDHPGGHRERRDDVHHQASEQGIHHFRYRRCPGAREQELKAAHR